MKSEQAVRQEMERLRKIILNSLTKMNIREKSVNRLEALEWILEDEKPAIEKRLKDAGIVADYEEETDS